MLWHSLIVLPHGRHDAEAASKCSTFVYLFVSSHSTVVCGMQAAEIWQELGEWITANKPQFGPGTKERFEMASKLTPEEVASHAQVHTDLHGTHGPQFLPSFYCSPSSRAVYCRALHHRAKWIKHAAELHSCALL